MSFSDFQNLITIIHYDYFGKWISFVYLFPGVCVVKVVYFCLGLMLKQEFSLRKSWMYGFRFVSCITFNLHAIQQNQ